MFAFVTVAHLQGAPVDVLDDDLGLGGMMTISVVNNHFRIDATAVDTDVIAVEILVVRRKNGFRRKGHSH